MFDIPSEASRSWQESPLAGSAIGEGLGLSGDTIRIDSWEIMLQGQWQPDIFGSARTRRTAAAVQLGAAEAQAVATRLAIVANVAQTYVQVRALLAQRAALEELIVVARQSERATQGFFSLGEATQLDVAAAAAELAALEAQRGELESGYVQAAFALDTLIDRPPGTARAMIGNGGRIPRARGEIPLGQPIELLQRRPDVIAATAQLSAAELEALATRRDLFPQIGVGATASRMGFSLADLSSTSNMAAVAAQLSFPWLSAANRAAVPIADADVEIGFVALRQAIAGSLQEVEVAAAEVAIRGRQQHAMAQAVNRQHERLSLAGRTYETGLANLTDVLEAQQGLLQARQQQAEAQAALAVAQIRLYTALGGGWRTQGAEDADLAAEPIPDRIGKPEGI